MLSKIILLFFACGLGVLLVKGELDVTYYEHSKTCSCGLKHGGSILQELTNKSSLFIGGAIWDYKMNELLYVHRLEGKASGYRPDTGLTFTMNVKELKNQQIAAFFPVDSDKHEYVVAANHTLYLLEVQGTEAAETYTLKEIMSVMDDSQIFTKGTTTKAGNLIIGTVQSDYNSPNSKKGQAQFLHINVATKKVTVVDKGFDFTGGVCFDRYYHKLYLSDVKMNKIWYYKYDISTGKTSDKKVIFDMADHEDTVHGRVTAICTDTEGNIWIALSRSYQILVYNPILMKIIRIIPVSSSVVNTIAFGGKHYDHVFVGTEQLFPVPDPKQEPASGTLIGISGTGHRGYKLRRVVIE